MPTCLEYFVDLADADPLLLVEFVDVALLAVHQEQAEAHHLDQHVLLLWRQVHLRTEGRYQRAGMESDHS